MKPRYTPLVARWVQDIVDAQHRLRCDSWAVGIPWDQVWDELMRRGVAVRTSPYVTYLDEVDRLRRDILAGRWPAAKEGGA